LRVVAKVFFQKEKLAAGLGEVVQGDAACGIERNNGAVPRENRQRLGVCSDGAAAGEFSVGFQAGPGALRQVDLARGAALIDGCDEHFVAQHEFVSVTRALGVVGKLEGQRVPGGVAVVSPFDFVDAKEVVSCRRNSVRPTTAAVAPGSREPNWRARCFNSSGASE
jgi:hypothetical protein